MGRYIFMEMKDDKYCGCIIDTKTNKFVRFITHSELFARRLMSVRKFCYGNLSSNLL